MDLSTLYDKFTVEVSCFESVGSGCIVQIDESDYTYVVTAKHCLEGTGDNPQEFTINDIKVRRFISEEGWKEFKALDYKLHNHADLAIIILKKLHDLETTIIFENLRYKDSITISGYPKALQGQQVNPKQNFIGDITYINESRIEFRTDDTLSTFKKEERTYIKGLSGSGIYKEFNNSLVLAGIFTEVKEKDVGYKILVGVPIYIVNGILQEAELPLLPKPTPYYILKRLGKYKYLWEWVIEPRLNNSSWVNFENSTKVINNITSHFLGSDENNVLHIIGRSGIGKTRTILRACQQTNMLSHVLYYQNYKALGNDFIDYIKQNEDVEVRIVIDDISLEEWERLNREFYDYYDRIRIVTIGVVPVHKQNQIEGLLIIEPPNDNDILSLIESIDSSLSEDDRTYLMGLCNRDLRLVMLLMEVSKREKVLKVDSMNTVRTKFDSLQSVMDRIIQLFHNEIKDKEKFFDHYIKLCLLVDVGYRGAFRREIEYICNYFSISLPDLSSSMEKASACWLGVAKGEFFETSPRALARLLFENEGWPLIKNDLDNFITNMPTTAMQKRFIDRAEECGKDVRKEVEAALAAWFLRTFPIYDMSLLEDGEKTKIFKVYAEFSPENGLFWLKNTITKASKTEILDLDKNYGKSRRYIVWLCEHLACFKDYFWDCEEIIFKLAQNETETHISNNSQGVWKEFFLPLLSNTEIPFLERYKLLITRLNRVEKQDLALILDAFKSIFSEHVSRIAPPKVVGGRVVPPEWKPATYEELYSIRKQAAQIFVENIEILNENIKEVVISFIVGNIEIFINYGVIAKVREALKDVEQSLIISLRNSLDDFISMTNKYDHNNKNYFLDAVDWRKSLQTQNLEEEILEFISRDYWGYVHRSNEEDVLKKTGKLVSKILMSKIDLNKFTSWFNNSKVDVNSVIYLAETIGNYDKEEIYSEYVIGLITENLARNFVVGYLRGRSKRESDLGIYEEILGLYKEKHPDFIVDLTLMFDITIRGYRRITYVIRNVGITNTRILYKFGNTEWEQALDEKLKIEILTIVLGNVQSSDAYYTILKILNKWCRQNDKAVSQERAKLTIDVLRTCLIEDITFDDWDWKEVIIRIPNEKFIHYKCDLLTLALVKWKSGHSHLENYALEEIKKLSNNYPEAIMKNLGEKMIDPQYRTSFFLNSYRGLFESISLPIVKGWIQKNGIDGALAMARHIKSPNPKENDKTFVPPLTEWLLSYFETNDPFFREFLAGRHSFEVYNVKDRVEQHDILVKELTPYLSYPLRRVREWAEYEIRDSETFRQSQEVWEARERREY